MHGRVAGKVALVTGASRGIGREIALTLGREGAAVGVNHLPDPEQAALEESCFVHRAAVR